MSETPCSAELPISNGVAYCIKPKDHDGLHRTCELTFGDSAAEAADEITRLRARVEKLEGALDDLYFCHGELFVGPPPRHGTGRPDANGYEIECGPPYRVRNADALRALTDQEKEDAAR